MRPYLYEQIVKSIKLTFQLFLFIFLQSCSDSESDIQLRSSISGAAAGTSLDVEYIEPVLYRDPGESKAHVYFPVKFICGEATLDDYLTAANYKTVVNVLNLSRFKANIGARLVVVGQSIVGPQIELPSNGSVIMDCEFIKANLIAQGIDVNNLLEGFLQLEDLTGEKVFQVVAVYSTLHKQLHDLPDLLPAKTRPFYCHYDEEGLLIVTIRNQGDIEATPSTTRVIFSNGFNVDLSTPTLNPGEQVELEHIEIPVQNEGPTNFTIIADVHSEVKESNESNNFVTGRCVIID